MKNKFVATCVIVAGILLAQGFVFGAVFLFVEKEHSEKKAAQGNIAEAVQSLASPVAQEEHTPLILDRYTVVRKQLIESDVEFLEINFAEDKVKKYEHGQVVQEASVLAKGDPQGWGGTPAGLYSVNYKNQNSFSGISGVYMPHAIHFYGKYLLHGEPYYPSGQKLASSISGGCIRLEDRNAESIYSSVTNAMSVFVVDKENDDYVYEHTGGILPPAVSAASYLVADVDSGYVFAEKKSTSQFSIASITKLMAALVVAENVDLRKSVTVTEEMLEAYGEIDGLEVGNQYRVVELFYPLLVISSNDVAEAIAGFLGRERTIQMMNEKAQAMLLQDTVFVDPSGFEAGNMSSAQDLFYLARYIRNNRPPLFEITRGENVRSYGEPQFARDALWNKNLFATDTSFAGGKTGYSTASKHTGVFLFQFLGKNDEVRTIAFIVLGSENDKLDTQRLYSWLVQNYQLISDYDAV